MNVPISEPDDSPRRRGLLGGQYKRQRSEDDKNSQDSFIVPDQDEATDPREDPDEDSDAPSHDYPHSPVHKRIKKRTVETPPSERSVRGLAGGYAVVVLAVRPVGAAASEPKWAKMWAHLTAEPSSSSSPGTTA